MNENDDGIFNTLTILSTDPTYSKVSGALTVNGGVGIKGDVFSSNIYFLSNVSPIKEYTFPKSL